MRSLNTIREFIFLIQSQWNYGILLTIILERFDCVFGDIEQFDKCLCYSA